MTTPHSAHRSPTHYDDVVGVEVTIDGMLVIADRLNLMDFPVALGIRLNIPQLELREIVWEQVARDLTAQGVLDLFGEPHPEVAAMVDTLSRADRTLEGRWWRRDGWPRWCPALSRVVRPAALSARWWNRVLVKKTPNCTLRHSAVAAPWSQPKSPMSIRPNMPPSWITRLLT